MAVFSSKDFSADNTLRIRNMVAAKLGVAAPATAQQCTDFLSYLLSETTKEHERDAGQAAVVVSPLD